MNTNSKHYEILAIEPWEIMERNLTTEEFVAYLKGNIIKYTLRDKGQALTDAEKIKHYAEKLIEVLETQENDKDNWTITGVKPEEVEDKPMIVKDSKFKVGDRVIVNDTSIHKKLIGTVIREPRDKQNGTEYLIELDEKEKLGWKATIAYHSVESERAWYTVEADLELLEEEPKKTLEPNKWYDAEDFTVEELKELLPVGTKVSVIEDFTTNNNDYNAVELGKETWLNTTVQNIDKTYSKERTRVDITGDIFFRRYFRIVGEN